MAENKDFGETTDTLKMAPTSTKPKKGDSAADLLAKQMLVQQNQQKEQDEEQKGKKDKTYYVSDKSGVQRRRRLRSGSEFEKADILRGKGFGELVTEKLMGDKSLGSSLKDTMKEKLWSKGMGIKKSLSIMNLLSKAPGGLGKILPALYGKARGKSKSEISYFTGVHAPSVPGQEDQIDEPSTSLPTATKSGVSGNVLGSKEVMAALKLVSRNTMPLLLMGKDIDVIRQNVKKLVEKIVGKGTSSDKASGKSLKEGELKEKTDVDFGRFLEQEQQKQETAKMFEEEKVAEDEKSHNELIETIKKSYRWGEKSQPETAEKEKKDGGGMLSMLADLISNFLGDKLKSILGGALGLAKKVGGGILRAGKSVAKFGGKMLSKGASMAKGAMGGIKSALGLGGKAAGAAKTGINTAKAALLQAKPGTAVKVAETAEKAGAALAKAGGTASKVAGAGSKLLKGGGKLLGFLKSVPGLSAIAAGADLVMRIQDVNAKLESGEITDADYKKEITKAIGGAAAAGLLPVLGAAVGSVIPGVGTLAGGLAGGAAALFGGDEIGAWLAGKMYDYFMEDKKEPEKKTAETASKVTPGGNKLVSVSPESKAPTQKQLKEMDKDLAAMEAQDAPPRATPVTPPPSPLGPRVSAATNESRNLEQSARNSAPVIINKTTNVSGGGSSGGGGGGGINVRNTEPVLVRLQYQSLRTI